MCGIVGYVGHKKAREVLIEGIKRLEYRGYDSAGICVHHAGALHVKKSSGRIAVLEQLVSGTTRSTRGPSASRTPAGRRTVRPTR
jgi:glucosamine--fructose-6-phosphate aminotransferase (isomerizing)